MLKSKFLSQSTFDHISKLRFLFCRHSAASVTHSENLLLKHEANVAKVVQQGEPREREDGRRPRHRRRRLGRHAHLQARPGRRRWHRRVQVTKFRPKMTHIPANLGSNTVYK